MRLLLFIFLLFAVTRASFYADNYPSMAISFPKKLLQKVDQTAQIKFADKING